MKRDQPWPYDADVAVSSTPAEVTLPAAMDEGLLGVLFEAIGYDEGKLVAGTLQTLQVQVIPEQQTEVYGGSTYHTFYAQPTMNSDNRHWLPLGFIARPGEAVRMTFKAAASLTVRVRVLRTKLFEARHRA